MFAIRNFRKYPSLTPGLCRATHLWWYNKPWFLGGSVRTIGWVGRHITLCLPVLVSNKLYPWILIKWNPMCKSLVLCKWRFVWPYWFIFCLFVLSECIFGDARSNLPSEATVPQLFRSWVRFLPAGLCLLLSTYCSESEVFRIWDSTFMAPFIP